MESHRLDRDIAIIGSGCRFPGSANSPTQLWNLLKNPRQLAEPIPIDRFSGPGYYHKSGQYHGHFNVKEAYFLAEEGAHRRFDASFFGMSPAEALCLDPQCRLLLETVYEAMEAAGLTVEALRGSDTAMYAGQMVADYDQIMMRDSDDSLGTYHASGTSHAILSNRISYFFDWHGPSMTIDTACSSSLVALHQAVQQLRTGHSRVAVAAGANLIMDPKCFISLSSLNMLSPDGRSRMWDAGANGYARGEGVAAVILKTLRSALEDGDDIECIIRESAFGQDGKTKGITSPSHAAQTQLIRDCYSRAGLDLTKETDRPQFFECHGTGTLAGDAAEAEAISTAFFRSQQAPAPAPAPIASSSPSSLSLSAQHDNSSLSSTSSNTTARRHPKLVVGSIKSVVGHTEGTAGIAGVMKAYLALKNATLPPNLLFERLNPEIEPFYGDLQVATAAAPWPSLPPGVPRRASVNSFGFGGANVHVVLESYEASQVPATVALSSTPSSPVFTPFVFSAHSQSSLLTYLRSFLQYLRDCQNNNVAINLHHLAHTLHMRRTGFPVTLSVAALSAEDLCAKLEAKLDEAAQHDPSRVVSVRNRDDRKLEDRRPRILGVFTGQGAQWAGMASDLIANSTFAAHVVARLEARLSRLPSALRPAWSLAQELQKRPELSRISEAQVSQTLCTAVQILQVDLLRAAGIEFSAIVGHSSGEIAAAYASGFITAEDAICIAYYRGLCTRLASGPNGQLGAMLAVGTSAEDAQDLLDDDDLVGRACIAAVNSAASVTISGDQNAVNHIKVVFEDEKKFARLLRVDKAYHSHHMMPCSAEYLSLLASLDIQVDQGQKETWFSSVFNGEDMSGRPAHVVAGAYWDINMTNPVLLKQAVTAACKAKGPFDFGIEVGPHPALKGPVLQTIQDVTGHDMPYTGFLKRNTSAIESTAEALGELWNSFGGAALHLQNYERIVSEDNTSYELAKGLPTYAWDHNEYWNESRYAKAIRLRPGPVHELLGHMTPDSNHQDLRWRHVLKPTEIPWLMGHRLQDQIVFPAAGYVTTALEAAMAMCRQLQLTASLIDFSDFEFGHALVFEGDDSHVEVVISMADIVRPSKDSLEANFRYHAAEGNSFNLVSTARVQISIGDPAVDILPVRSGPKPPNLVKVPAEEYYSASRETGYQWAGPFVALDELERKLGATEGVLHTVEQTSHLIHPAVLDALFQGVLLAYSYPGDGQLWTIHVPGRIRRVAFNPMLCEREMQDRKPLPFSACHHPDTEDMIGNADIYPSDPLIGNAIIQCEELTCVPLTRATPQDDREPFATVIWDVASPNPRAVVPANEKILKEKEDTAEYMKRLAYFYLRNLDRDTPKDSLARTAGPYQTLLHFASQMPAQPQWEKDTREMLIAENARTAEYQLLCAVGDLIADNIENEKPELEPGVENIIRFCDEAPGPLIARKLLAGSVKQLTHRYPNMDILHLDVGGQTGGTVFDILGDIGTAFSSYTFTTASEPSLKTAQNACASWVNLHANKLIFKTLDIAQDPADQGFSRTHSYDVIVASFAFLATPDRERSLHHARQLLKPGGHLLALELLPTDSLVWNLISSTISNGQSVAPTLSLVEWDTLLRQTGFSGCDRSTDEPAQAQDWLADVAVFSSQAVDARQMFLRHPLDYPVESELFQAGTLIPDLIILGGTVLKSSRLVEDIKRIVSRHCGRIRSATRLSELSRLEVSSTTTVLSIAHLDAPTLANLGEVEWEALKKVLMTAGTLLWVTSGRRAEDPFANMVVGLLRSVVREVPSLQYQVLDLEGTRGMPSPQILAEALLRFQAETTWSKEGDLFTSVENELVIDSENGAWIPRLILNDPMNRRYNSLKRSVVADVDPHVEAVGLEPKTDFSGFVVKQEPVYQLASDTPMLEVTQSLVSAIRVAEFSCLFPLLGRSRASARQVLTLSSRNCSIVELKDEVSVDVDLVPGSEAAFLAGVVYSILTHAIYRGLSAREFVLIYEPPMELATILADEASRQGISVTFVTSTPEGTEPTRNKSLWRRIHPSAPSRALSGLVSRCPSVFVDFGTSTTSLYTSDRIRSLLPVHCRRESIQTLFSSTALMSPGPQSGQIRQRLHQAVDYASSKLGEGVLTGLPDTITLGSHGESSQDQAISPWTLVDWKQTTRLPMRIRPKDTQIAFSGERTYWLAGLSRGLGLALCEWMFRRGARYFVISSRNPQIDPVWLSEMLQIGATVKIASCDVTVRAEVLSLHDEISSTMPPIAGVAQGSMVLEDTAFRDMTLNNFLRGTRPKVEGSIHLDEAFQENNLDFFILFSSVVAVIGRPGQANYSAANMFMASLAEQRRRKGLAGSVIHIGPIYGIGYATGKGIYSKANFRSTGLTPASERDFYQLFAEAIAVGRTGASGQSIELFNGARPVYRHENDRPVWEAEPLMSHFIRTADGLGADSADNQAKVPLKTQLAQANDRAQVHNIIRDAFLPKVYSLFQLDSGKVSTKSLVEMRLDEMGIDSLIAVDIRGWFIKTLEVNIPVLKILSGVPIGDLVAMAAETIPDRLVPGLQLGVDEETESSGLSVSATEMTSSEDASSPVSAPESDSSDTDSTKETGIVLPESDAPRAEIQVQKTLKLSLSQEMFWFVGAFLQDKTSLNHTAWARITGRINIERFRRAFHILTQEHESLRTAVIEQNGRPVQVIMKTTALDLEIERVDSEEDVQKIVALLRDRHVYNVAQGQTVRAFLLTRSPEEHFFVGGLHPLIADGFSFQTLLQGLQQLYTRPDALSTHTLYQFSDYSEKQHGEIASGKLDGDLAFWRDEFAALPPPLPILTVSTATSRPPLTVYENLQTSIRVRPETKQRIIEICRRCRATPFHFYLSTFRALLLRHAPVGDGEDLAIGIGDANRTEDELMGVIGPLVNLLPVRIRASSSDSFTELLQETRKRAYAALEHSKVPFQLLLNELNVPRSAGYTSLFQAFANYRQGLRSTTQWGPNRDLVLHTVEIGLSKMAYDVTLEMVDYLDGDCVQTLIVRKDLYGQTELQCLAESYDMLLEAFVQDATASLDEPALFQPSKIERVAQFSRGPTQTSEWPETTVHRIDDIAALRPQSVAVWSEGLSTTYQELLGRARAIAHVLSAVDVGTGEPVAVLLNPGSAFISSLLGIMRIGAVYLPLDMNLPWARLAAMVKDCQPSVVLVDENSLPHVGKLGGTMKVISVSDVDINAGGITVPISSTSSSPAAILYTSGSSGAPKGILVKHEGLRNWTEHVAPLYHLDVEVVLQQTTPMFDLSLVQIFTALCYGGSLCVIPRHQRGDAEAISEIITKHQVTFTCGTPSEYASWIHYGRGELAKGSSWKTAFAIGEGVPVSLVGQFSSLGRKVPKLYNLYGPTEASLACTGMEVPLTVTNGPIAAGKPLPNYSLHVLDDRLRPVAAGTQGEIFIGGAGVGLGYLNQKELTAKKFVPDPFATVEDKAAGWTIMHRTGDLGRWQDDGTLLVEGRLDTQVKLRGLRLDLGEIEHAILEVSKGAVREAVVSVRTWSPEKPAFLIAHVVPANPDSGSLESQTERLDIIRSQLSRHIPQYMCPAAMIPLPKLPVSTAGKLDRRQVASLPLSADLGRLLDITEDSRDVDVDLTSTQTRLRPIWEKILSSESRPKIVAQTDFFHIGGTSMLLLPLRKRISEEFGVSMPLVSMFASSTLSAMAEWIDLGSQVNVKTAFLDWDQETQLEPALMDLKTEPLNTDSLTKPATVVVSGATGTLGRSLLRLLIEDATVEHIHCVGVRNAAGRRDLFDLDGNSRVTLHEGDLIKPLLGLSEEKAADVFGAADAIIHNAADMSYLKTYASLREVNLESTKELIRMSARYGTGRGRGFVPFHFISTISVGNVVAASLSETEARNFIFDAVSVGDYTPAQPSAVASNDLAKMAQGYVATKWASERFLERLHGKYPDWPIVIHRPSLIAREWNPASGADPGLEFVENVRQYSSLIGAVPVLPRQTGGSGSFRVNGFLNVVPLSQAARGVVGALGDHMSGLRYLHHLGTNDLPFDDVKAWGLESASSGSEEIGELSVAEWLERAKAMGLSTPVAALLENIATLEGQIALPRVKAHT